MKKRQVVIIIVAIAVLALGKLLSDLLAAPKEKLAKKPKMVVATVFTVEVKNDSIPIYIEATGVLEAVKRFELYSEVQGVMMPDDGRFKAGNSFRKGELLIAIRSNDQQAQLYSQRSSFESSIAAIMPDLKVDYPYEFQAWQSYLNSLSTEKMTSTLPEVNSDKLKSFLVGRGIYSSYHALRNIEILNQKYNITAPYDGVLVSANADPGTVIRSGQALGVFIQPNKYEIEVSVDATSSERLALGQKVQLTMKGIDKQWEGEIARLVKAINVNNQMSSFFVKVDANDLKEGLFMNAKVLANKVPNAIEISRSSLLENNQLYVVKGDSLVLQEVKPEYFGKNTAVVSGLKNGEQVLVKVPPSAFPGMKVSIYKEGE